MATESRGSLRPDLATLLGLLISLGGIVGGLILEGGHVGEILAPTAAMIVLGGTIGAVMVTTPLGVLVAALKGFAQVFFERSNTNVAVIEELVGYATKARKHGIVSLEQEAAIVKDPFLRKALTLAVDGTDLQEIRKMMELEIEAAEHDADAESKVFESAGGYAPTIGIIGAVLGLIQTMKSLADIDKVGEGIATAFVATIYGVGSANILFLPAGAKIRSRAHARTRQNEMILEGVTGIVEGMNPKLIRSKLEAYAKGGKQQQEQGKAGGNGKA